MQRGMQRCTARQTDRRWRQAGARIRVVRAVITQIDQAQIAVESAAKAVDDGRIGLQPHAEAQPPHEHAGDLCALGWRTGFLLRSEEHTSELQSLMRTSYAVFCL